MLMQRLTAAGSVGFGYDYMGSAEYENDAPRAAREALARLFIEGALVARTTRLAEMMGRMTSPSVDVVVMGSPAEIERLGDPAVIRVTKEPLRVTQDGIAGWMKLPESGEKDFSPLLVVRLTMPEEEIASRVESFLSDPIAYVRSLEA